MYLWVGRTDSTSTGAEYYKSNCDGCVGAGGNPKIGFLRSSHYAWNITPV